MVGAEMTRPSRVMPTACRRWRRCSRPRWSGRRVEVEHDDPLAGRRLGAGGGVGDVGALDDRRAEQVLGGAVVGAGGDVVVGPGDVAGASFLSQVERGVRGGGLLLGHRRGVGSGAAGRRPRRGCAAALSVRPGRRRRSGWRPRCRSARRRPSVGAARVGAARRRCRSAAWAAGSGPLEHRAEAQLGGRAELAGLVPVVAGHGDDDVRVALGDHLGLGDTEPVDPLLDDLAGELEVLLGRRLAVGRLGGERHGRAAAQVQPELRASGCR